MPIQSPGPRLLSSVPFQHFGGRVLGGRKETNVNLILVPFIDVMTMLVIFLLMTFSATGELMMSQKGVELPVALNDKDLERAAIITITRTEVAFKGEPVGTVEALNSDTSMEWKIVELYDRLKLYQFDFEKQDIPEEKKAQLRGMVVLQADKSTPAKVLNRVMKTAYAAEFTDVMFAITKKGRRGG